MKKLSLWIAASALIILSGRSARAEDLPALDPELAKTFAKPLAEAAEKVDKPQVKFAGESDKAVGVHRGAVGLLLVPRKGLEEFDMSGVESEQGAGLAHLFMHSKVTPVIDGQLIDAGKLRSVSVKGPDGKEHKFNYLLLAVRNVSGDDWRLLAYGADAKPLVSAPIGENSGPGSHPLALEVKDVQSDYKSTLVVTIMDRFQASFKVGYKQD